jgi:hypothetical protein
LTWRRQEIVDEIEAAVEERRIMWRADYGGPWR